MKDDRLYLIHISESIARIESYTSGMDFAAFIKNTLVQDAVIRNLQVLAESTQSGDIKLAKKYWEDWRKRQI